MAFNFPDAPTNGQIFSPAGGPTYIWDSAGAKWTTVTGTTASASNVAFTPVGDIAATTVQGAIAELAAEPKGWRNRIINGDFAIDQRNNGAVVTCPIAANTYTVDRWYGAMGQSPGVIYLYRLAASANLGEYTLLVQPQTIDATIAAGDHYRVTQNIEGHMLRGLNWGAANAKPITISFNCADIGGPFTLPIAIRNSASDRVYISSFTTGTNRITITVPGDTTGTWLYDSGIGIRVEIGLAIGTTYHAAANTWGTSGLGLAGMSNFMASASNQLYIRDFQLEVGTVATDFERVPYDEQLARCRRYFEAMTASTATGPFGAGVVLSTTNAQTVLNWKIAKRAAPTVIFGTATDFEIRAVGTHVASVITAAAPIADSCVAVATITGATAGQGAILRAVSAAANIQISAEL